MTTAESDNGLVTVVVVDPPNAEPEVVAPVIVVEETKNDTNELDELRRIIEELHAEIAASKVEIVAEVKEVVEEVIEEIKEGEPVVISEPIPEPIPEPVQEPDELPIQEHFIHRRLHLFGKE